MNSHARLSMRLSAVAMASALLFGCGGGQDTTPVVGAATESVQMAGTASALSVRMPSVAPSASSSSGVASTSTTSSATTVLMQTQYAFAATFTAGPHAGQNLAGTLLLRMEDEDDGTIEVEGQLVPTTAVGGTAGMSADGAAQVQAIDLHVLHAQVAQAGQLLGCRAGMLHAHAHAQALPGADGLFGGAPVAGAAAILPLDRQQARGHRRTIGPSP